MIQSFFHLLYISLPTVIGIAVGCSAAFKNDTYRPGFAAVFSGIGIIGSHLILAAAVWSLNQMSIQVFTLQNFIFLCALGIISVSVAVYVFQRGTSSLRSRLNSKREGISRMIMLAIAALVLIACYQHLWLPVFGWDSLQHWMDAAARFVENDVNDAGHAEPFIFYHRHPITVSLFGAFSGHIAAASNHQLGLLLPWLGAWLALLLLVFGFVSSVARDTALAVLLCYVCATVPLLENHVLVAGYSEIWLAAVVSAAVVMITLGIQYKVAMYVFIGVCFAIGPIWIKNTGPAFSFAILCPLVLLFLLNHLRYWSVAVFSLAAVFLIWLSTRGFEISLAGNKFAFSPDPQAPVFTFGGKVMLVAPQSWLDVFNNEFHALIINQSFTLWSVIFITAISTTVVRTRHGDFENNQEFLAQCFLLLCTLLMLAILLISQLLLDRGFHYATPDRDTGNSRFSLPLIVLGIIYSGHAFSNLLSRDAVST